MLCAKFGWNWLSGSWEEDENVKSLQTDGQTYRQIDGRTDRRTDDGQQAIRKAHLSFQLRWGKNVKEVGNKECLQPEEDTYKGTNTRSLCLVDKILIVSNKNTKHLFEFEKNLNDGC